MIEHSADRAADFEVELSRQRRFRGLIAMLGCFGVFAVWGVFVGVPLAVMAWRYWFGC